MKTLLAFSFAALLAAPAFGADPAPTPSTLCSGFVLEFQHDYQALYNVDARPLAVDQYEAYRTDIEGLRTHAEDLAKFCANPAAIPAKSENIYEKKAYSWVSQPSETSNCGAASAPYSFSSEEGEYETTAVRECYRDGYSVCALKEGARIFDVEAASQNSDKSWNCSVQMDLVISATK